jgi:hypothetical protein
MLITCNPDDLAVTQLLAVAFETFVARSLGTPGEVALTEPESNPNDASTIENEFSGKTWHNLI